MDGQGGICLRSWARKCILFLAHQRLIYQPNADLASFCTMKLHFITWTDLIVSLSLPTGEWNGIEINDIDNPRCVLCRNGQRMLPLWDWRFLSLRSLFSFCLCSSHPRTLNYFPVSYTGSGTHLPAGMAQSPASRRRRCMGQGSGQGLRTHPEGQLAPPRPALPPEGCPPQSSW